MSPNHHHHSKIQASNSIDLMLANEQAASSSTTTANGVPQPSSPRTPRSKPRGVRKKWGFHFGGSKSGSLKSIKSNKSGDSTDNLDGSKDYSK